jgi:hypothetical protein
MPKFTDVPVDVEFEVFCQCGAGLCNQSDTRSSRARGMPQVVVEPCEKCLKQAAEKAADDVRDELQAQIAELESELAGFRQANATV